MRLELVRSARRRQRSQSPPASGAAVHRGVCLSQERTRPLGPLPHRVALLGQRPFDNVADYNGYTMSSGIYSLDNGPRPSPASTRIRRPVTVSREGTFWPGHGAVLRGGRARERQGRDDHDTGYRFASPNATG